MAGNQRTKYPEKCFHFVESLIWKRQEKHDEYIKLPEKNRLNRVLPLLQLWTVSKTRWNEKKSKMLIQNESFRVGKSNEHNNEKSREMYIKKNKKLNWP